MKELQQIVDAKLKEMAEDGSLAKRIEDGIESAVNKAINSQFESYGDITKEIEKAIKEGLKINLSDLPFQSYNEQMLVAVKTKLGEFFKGVASNKFMAEMDKVLSPAPKQITIVEFVDTIAKAWKTDEPWNADELDESASVEISDDGSSIMRGVTLKMWKQKESGYSHRENIADLQLYIIDGKIRISHKQSYNPTCFSEHESFVFKLYAAGTLITGIDDFDEDDCDLTLKDTEY